MNKSGNLLDKLKAWVASIRQDMEDAARAKEAQTGWQKAQRMLKALGRLAYHLRKMVMAAPVVYYALKLAAYNSVNLPESVGLNLQANGAFAQTVSRTAAVNGSLMLTGGCLVLMLLSRKTVYPWVISIFSLIVPVMLLITNLYPC